LDAVPLPIPDGYVVNDVNDVNHTDVGGAQLACSVTVDYLIVVVNTIELPDVEQDQRYSDRANWKRTVDTGIDQSNLRFRQADISRRLTRSDETNFRAIDRLNEPCWQSRAN